MKIQCTQENLNKGLNLVSRVVANPKTLPILSNILLSSEKGLLRISATNLEIGINGQGLNLISMESPLIG